MQVRGHHPEVSEHGQGEGCYDRPVATSLPAPGYICKSRPLLDSMLSHMAEAERLGPVVGMGEPTANTSDGESNCSPNRISNHKDFSLSEDDMDDQELDEIVFGTTV